MKSTAVRSSRAKPCAKTFYSTPAPLTPWSLLWPWHWQDLSSLTKAYSSLHYAFPRTTTLPSFNQPNHWNAFTRIENSRLLSYSSTASSIIIIVALVIVSSAACSHAQSLSTQPSIMPGILPMKVIKVGTSTQSRIAQACDRCRSKKIRCDGVTPCCTQCKNVGFECKTSDKLSRRAFPRGYTESLEERVRALEAEVRELKDLLDEKDEKIDLLSKIHAFSPGRRLSNTASPTALDTAASPQHESGEEVFKVQQVPFLQKPEQKSDPFFMGSSSTRAFVGKKRAAFY